MRLAKLARVAKQTLRRGAYAVLASSLGLASLAGLTPFLSGTALAATSAIDHLAFTTTAQTINTNSPSGVITVQTQNASNSSESLDTSSNSLTVSSSSPTAMFATYSSGTCSTFSSGNFTATMANGTANKNFCYQDSSTGTFTLTATLSASGGASSWTATQAITVTNDVVINSVADLRNAIENQADGQTWTINAGNYGLSPFTDITAEGQTGWYFPITANNLTINGSGNPTIYGTGYTADGAWATQNLITIIGNNVKIYGLTLMPKVEPNKTIEVLGSDTTIENVVVKPNTLTNQTEYNNLSDQTEKDWGGSIYYNNAGGTQTLSNVTIYNGGLSDHAPNATLNISNVSLDYSTSADWINAYRFAMHGNSANGTPQVTYHVSSSLNNLDDVLTNAQSGDTIQLDSNLSTSQQLTLTKAVTFDGKGYTLSPSFTKTSSDNNSAIGIQSSDVTVKDLTIDGTSGTNLHGINVYESTGINLNTVTIKNNGHAALNVNGSNVTATGLNTSNNAWGSVNVDPGSGVTDPSVFTLNSGTLSEANQIWSDGSNVTSTATVTVNAPSGYNHYYLADNHYNIWTNDLTNVASLTHNSTTSYYSTIQAAVNASSAGDTINVAPGTYSENVSVNKAVTLQGAGSGSDASSNTILSGTTGNGLSLSAGTDSTHRVVVKNIRVTGYTNGVVASSYNTLDNVISTGNSNYGINLNSLTDLSITSSSFDDNSVGLKLATSGSANNVSVSDSHFDNNSNQGWYIAATSSSTTNQNDFNDISVTNSTFSNNGQKGLYIEKANNATFDGITADSNGTSSSLTYGSGFNLNLKYGAYQNVTLKNSTVTGNGTGDATNGTGVNIEARDDGSYASNPATLSGVTVSDNTITGNQVGLRFGETGKNNAGPTNVTVSGNTITGNIGLALVNETQATDNATYNWWGTPDNSTIGSEISDNVTYKPYYTDSGMSSLSTAASLTSLSPTRGTISPTFSSSTTAYTASVGYTITSLSIGTTASTGAQVSGDGSHNLSVGSNKFTITVTSADGTVSSPYTLTVTRAAATQTVVTGGQATVTSSQPQVVVTNNTTPVTITVASGTTNASIDFSSLKTSSTSAVVPQTTINSSTATVSIPASTKITSSGGTWDGTITAPTVQPSSSVSVPTSAGTVNTIGTVIEVGSDTANLTFSKAVKLTIPGQAGMLVGFQRNGTFTKITTQCSANTQAAGDALPAGGDCYIVSGNDMVVWTKHFTQFVTYSVSNKYVVKSGDTFGSIAASAGLTLNQLEKLNPSAGHPAGNFSLIYPGDVLRLGGSVVTASAQVINTSKPTASTANPKVLGASEKPGTIGTAYSTKAAPAAAAAASKGLKWYWWVVILAVIAALGSAVYVYRQTGEKR